MLSCVIICFESFFGLLYLNLNACMLFLAFVFNFGNCMTTCSCLFPILHYLFWKFAVCLYVNLAVHSSLHKGLEATSRNVSHRWTTLWSDLAVSVRSQTHSLLSMWVIHLSSISLDFACVLWLGWLFVSYTRGTFLIAWAFLAIPFNYLFPLLNPFELNENCCCFYFLPKLS
jgi:hypothetical protein